jgi:hypothetical protein
MEAGANTGSRAAAWISKTDIGNCFSREANSDEVVKNDAR